MSTFAEDVLSGLSSDPKRLPSRYFYDARGDELFQQIMRMPEYYLTNCEFEILETHRQAILEKLPQTGFDLVELGAGDGYKTKLLLRHFLEQNIPFRYLPIDISQNALDQLEQSLRSELPDLEVSTVRGEYFRVLARLRELSNRPKLVLFLGANIGNLLPESAREFLCGLANELAPGDHLLIGFDLKKDPDIILQAYNDPAGITAAFNLNLLHRINRELDADFQTELFRHWETYHPITGETRSYLVSKQYQNVHIRKIDSHFSFQAWEAIEVELSLKYAPEEIENLARDTGFQVADTFHDSRKYFQDSLWKKP